MCLRCSRVLLIGVALANLAAADTPRLRYLIERLGNAESAELVAPGADGTGYAFRLRHRLGSWSRFNWPLFDPVPGSRSVVFRARRSEGEPPSLVVRILTEDGNEWQGPRLDLADTWQTYRLTNADFRFFRGDRPQTAAPFDLGRAIQFQVVPTTTAGPGMGEFLVDAIRFLPDGPGWDAGSDELRAPIDSLRAEWQRVDDLVRRWQAEGQRLEREHRQAGRWLSELEDLLSAGRDAGRTAEAPGDWADRALPWRQPPQCPPPRDAMPGVAWEDFRQQVAAADESPVTLIELSPDLSLEQTRLYAAPSQEDPEVVDLQGKLRVRHRLRFRDDDTQQVVFTVLPLPEPRDLEGQRLLLRMRCTAGTLNEELPLVLRLFTESEEPGESWGDLAPAPMPGEEWTEVQFDVSQPLRGTRFAPARTRSLAVRLENSPGAGGEFQLELAEIRVAPPAALPAVRRRELRAAEARVAAARSRLYARRDRIARLEDDLRAFPALRRAYLSSFEAPWSRESPAGSRPEMSPLDSLALPPVSVRPAAVRSRTVAVAGRPALRLEASDRGEGHEILAELRDRNGRLQAAGRARGGELTLVPAAATAWAPGEPHVYRLRCLVRAGEQVLSYSERLVGLRTADVRAGGPDALLRHTRFRRQPDWTYRLNGRCFFPRVAAYHWPDAEETVLDGVRLLGDLWVDGIRRYGFSFQPHEWDRFSRYGLGMFTSLAPRYGSLTGWEDVAAWDEDDSRRCRRVIAASDSPHQLMAQVGNEAELTIWGAELGTAFPDALYQPLDMAAERQRAVVQPTAPTMYVRAASFHRVPPLPHEQVCGVNQYTGRYSGRMEQIDRNLSELARRALWADRPLMITEWMGPKYSWAGTGVGGVTRRGAAYYLERYWRALIDTPGVIGSAQFTLNWVIAPFEDLTNQSREEAWVDRPPHSPFGGGRTADHIPQVGPREAQRDEPTFRSMQAFHGPLYLLVHRPGPILITGEDAERVAAPLRRFRDGIETADTVLTPETEAAAVHLVRLWDPDDREELPGEWDEPIIRTQRNPANPDGLLVSLHAASPRAADRGLQRLIEAAEALAELNRLEGAMTRAVAVTDRAWETAYENYLLEFAARGYLHCGDDVRRELREEEFFDANGSRRPAWQDLSAVILDTERVLESDEIRLVRRLTRQGANLIISAPSYTANPALADLLDAQLEPAGDLGQNISLETELTRPVPVEDLGGVDRDVIARFQPDLANAAGLDVFAIRTDQARTLAANADGRAIIVQRTYGAGRVTLMGTSLGAAIHVHQRVTRSGKTHRLYDRDTASGLERLSRVVVNGCRLGFPPEQYRPRLYLEIIPESTWVPAGEPVRLTVQLTDVDGQPVPGQLRGGVRITGMRSAGGARTELTDLTASGPGRFEIVGWPEGEDRSANHQFEVAEDALPSSSAANVLTYPAPESGAAPHVLSLQFKGFAADFIPTDGALAVLLAP